MRKAIALTAFLTLAGCFTTPDNKDGKTRPGDTDEPIIISSNSPSQPPFSLTAGNALGAAKPFHIYGSKKVGNHRVPPVNVDENGVSFDHHGSYRPVSLEDSAGASVTLNGDWSIKLGCPVGGDLTISGTTSSSKISVAGPGICFPVVFSEQIDTFATDSITATSEGKDYQLKGDVTIHYKGH